MNFTEFASIFREIDLKQSDHEHLLQWRYPWFNMVFNYLYAFLVLLLAVSLIWCSGNDYKDRKEAEAQNERDRIQTEELANVEEQKQKEFNDMMDRWAKAGAKMLFGIRRFIDKYGYTEKDLETYLRCAWNRYLFYGKLTDLDVLIFTPEQFLECYKTNPSDQYEAFCRKLFMEWYEEDAEGVISCDPSYIFAELLPDGIFLSKEYGADGYAIRWKAQ